MAECEFSPPLINPKMDSDRPSLYHQSYWSSVYSIRSLFYAVCCLDIDEEQKTQ